MLIVSTFMMMIPTLFFSSSDAHPQFVFDSGGVSKRILGNNFHRVYYFHQTNYNTNTHSIYLLMYRVTKGNQVAIKEKKTESFRQKVQKRIENYADVEDVVF
eukprot:Sdes_comp23747_c0_seq1m21916